LKTIVRMPTSAQVFQIGQRDDHADAARDGAGVRDDMVVPAAI
jgi:hypothetical protein